MKIFSRFAAGLIFQIGAGIYLQGHSSIERGLKTPFQRLGFIAFRPLNEKQ
jgi:hypothetical protein